MKKIKLLVFFLVALTGQGVAQTLSEFLANSQLPLTFLGVDFSQMRYLHAPSLHPGQFKSQVIPDINTEVVNHPQRYDIAASFYRQAVHNDLSQVKQINASIDTSVIKSNTATDFQRLQPADIASVARHYSGEGIGLLFVVEAADCKSWKVAVYVVLTALGTGEVLLSKRYIKRGRAGIQWTAALAATLKDISGRDYKRWKKANS
ncbi:hypothetical protein GA0116948_101404 [Chitinophaga costaii]|uniref:Uncharacterized protein n=1 Tax=Chitinophaga costaii TaxID=1335309 RepID=A0A1C3ZI65_9BACT|nr:hypothetical protein [Chitinophaga costaii]PUZ30378.1 hypothetical protein DCM91_02580 [Chitinophaga costaii]SCB81910.1 hypothetical protein GA0116948_101404 [Chitinophaga costaii]